MRKDLTIAFYTDYSRFDSKEAPPILFFISFLRNIGYKVDFFTDERTLLCQISARRFDICLISLLSADNLRNVLQTAIKIKNINPLIINILGGTGISGYRRDLIEAEGIDSVIEGDAEKILPALLDSIIKTKKPVFKSYPENLKSEIKKEEAFFCTESHMQLLFGRKGQYLSPISEIPETVFFDRRFSVKHYSAESAESFENEINVKCPISGVAVKLNDGAIRFFDKIDIEHSEFDKFYEPYKNLISKNDFSELIVPYPTEEEINNGYKDYPWDIYDEQKFESIGIYAQRGCNWGKCTYCSIENYRYRKLDIDFITKILKEAKQHNVTGVSFDDDLFIQNKKWINTFLDAILKEGLSEKLNFTAMFKVEHIHDFNLLDRLKLANFNKIQIGVESFLPKKLIYFSKTVRGKEKDYVEKAKEIIDYCAKIGIIPASFIILTAPGSEFGLFDIISEIGEIIDLTIGIGEKKYKNNSLPVFLFNDFITAYPNAPLLKSQEYSKFVVALGGKISETNILNLRKMNVPYLYKFEDFKVAVFIDKLLKQNEIKPTTTATSTIKLPSDIGISGDTSLTLQKFTQQGELAIMFAHIKSILNALKDSFNLYGKPLFLLYDIVDNINSSNEKNNEILKNILRSNFQAENANKFKNLLTSGKINLDGAISLFKSLIGEDSFNELKKLQTEDGERGKTITKILKERLETFEKRLMN